MNRPLLEETVRTEWVDYNGHMNDAEYARVFSIAVDQLMNVLGIDASFRSKNHYSIYTLETHLCYLAEAHKDQTLHVSAQLLNHDDKRLHVFFIMENSDGEKLATSEQMLMGMDMEAGRPAPFPSPVSSRVQEFAKESGKSPYPDQAGRKIGIKKKKSSR
ncbi:acyl-CoA thioester hydrolase [Scopulibacillus darangshiensis]|uniref:Acyl-CoA thioester hydrolase n=1 Tax=Scopulibacillus darangshiensis TaxID=442528 RepID=A0A4R2P6T7_9BACL|nr:thioesterase family protein [Scopulibacillus darangshiensis]TCP30573.1 acyl-CoA thioester hydrolase [Scopulibacillus darangshiensis]